MKIQTVDTYRCDNPKCHSEFTLSDKKIKGEASFHTDAAHVCSSRTEFVNMNGYTFCPSCTRNILDAMGR